MLGEVQVHVPKSALDLCILFIYKYLEIELSLACEH